MHIIILIVHNINGDDFMLDKLILCLPIIGAINWGLVGIFDIDLVALIFGNMTLISRILYTLIGLAGIWSVTLLFKRFVSQAE